MIDRIDLSSPVYKFSGNKYIFVPVLHAQSSLRCNHKIKKMKEFLLVFRADYKTMPNASPEEMQATTQRWMNWVAGIAAQEKLVDRGNRLVNSGKVLKSDGVISDGPYTEIKESILGYTLVKATSLDEATALAKGCPVLSIGGNVEIREINAL